MRSGPGEITRAALGRPQFGFIFRNDRNILLSGLVVLWWLAIAAVVLLANRPTALLAAAAIADLAVRGDVAALAFAAGRRLLRSGLERIHAVLPARILAAPRRAERMDASSVIQDRSLTAEVPEVMQR